MSDTVRMERGRYQATGKHWFALKLIVALVILGLLSTLPVRGSVMYWGYALVASHGIFEAGWLLLKPQRSREAAEDGNSIRTVRFQGAFLLVAWATLLTFAIQNLF